eukprot:15088160-Alexandrium_andersonii.AAC.1
MAVLEAGSESAPGIVEARARASLRGAAAVAAQAALQLALLRRGARNSGAEQCKHDPRKARSAR